MSVCPLPFRWPMHKMVLWTSFASVVVCVSLFRNFAMRPPARVVVMGSSRIAYPVRGPIVLIGVFGIARSFSTRLVLVVMAFLRLSMSSSFRALPGVASVVVSSFPTLLPLSIRTVLGLFAVSSVRRAISPLVSWTIRVSCFSPRSG